MRNIITASHKNSFGKVWISLLTLVLVITAARFLFFNSQPPSLAEVLSQQSAQETRRSQDLSLVIASLVAFSMAALSLAKGVEIVKRKRDPEMILPELKDEPSAEELAKDRELDELKQSKEALVLETGEMQTKLRISACEIDELKRIEQMLRKSNISLGKECERLKADNEDLMLKANSVRIKIESEKPKKVVKAATARVLTKKTKTRAKSRKKR